MEKTIVVSAVNLKVGGTLAILRDCLNCLSRLAESGGYRIVALVYDKNSANYPNIEYIEMQWPKKNWLNRLWCEYVSMKKISKRLSPVYLWLSLHDTTPSVVAQRRAVYCHNSFPFYKWKARELFFSPKIVLFALFSRYIYRINIHKNKYLVVQQQWFKDAFIKMFELSDNEIIVAPPSKKGQAVKPAVDTSVKETKSFFYPAMSDSHKNFECICEAVRILETEYAVKGFEVNVTIRGDENKYTKWVYRKWHSRTENLRFVGYLDKTKLYQYYESCDALIFPSKVETWGLPITEFAAFDKPMLLSDLPYAHETAGGSRQVAFFDPESPRELALQMKGLIEGDTSFLTAVEKPLLVPPVARSWDELFEKLLKS
ncbi:MAG: glycosyltransferase family 4 protein [Dysgonamonadaceae bacterium]|jgi:glycosyltransferase involved in cell wall biosynthesis|nr:glycosyltransferase family 4 protein [Dysgonamonadaceae bacterium]